MIVPVLETASASVEPDSCVRRNRGPASLFAEGSLMHPPIPPRAVRLTHREIEILQAVASGRTSKEIAGDLFLSKRTIDFHLAHIYGRLNVNNRIGAIKAGMRLGMIVFEPGNGN